MEALLTVDEGTGHKEVEQPAADAVFHKHVGAHLDVVDPLREEDVSEHAGNHKSKPQDERGHRCLDPAGGAIDGGLAKPDEKQHNSNANDAEERERNGCTVKPFGNVAEIA